MITSSPLKMRKSPVYVVPHNAVGLLTRLEAGLIRYVYNYA